MSTPVLTAIEKDTLNFLASGAPVSKNRSLVVRNDRIAERQRVADAISSASTVCSSGACGFDPIQDSIDYHSQSVADGIDQEIAFIERVDSYWIAQSHAIACEVYKIQAEIANHWDDNQHPHNKWVMGKIYSTSTSRNYGNTEISCKTALARVRDGTMHSTMWAARRATHRGYERFRADSEKRPGEVKARYTVEAATAHATQHLLKWHLRRQYMYKQNYIEMSNAVYYAGSRQNPDSVFQLMSNAQGLVADIGAGAAQQQNVQKQSTLSKVGQVIGIAASVASFF